MTDIARRTAVKIKVNGVDISEDISKYLLSFSYSDEQEDKKIRYYYNPSYCQSAVHEEMRYVFTHTGCRFFTDW